MKSNNNAIIQFFDDRLQLKCLVTNKSVKMPQAYAKLGQTRWKDSSEYATVSCLMWEPYTKTCGSNYNKTSTATVHPRHLKVEVAD